MNREGHGVEKEFKNTFDSIWTFISFTSNCMCLDMYDCPKGFNSSHHI